MRNMLPWGWIDSRWTSDDVLAEARPYIETIHAALVAFNTDFKDMPDDIRDALRFFNETTAYFREMDELRDRARLEAWTALADESEARHA